MRAMLMAGAALLAVSGPASAVTISVEAAGVTNSTVAFDVVGVETFNSRSPGGGQTFSTTFVSAGPGQPVQITGEYRNVQINGPDQFSNNTNYPVAFGSTPYSLLVSGMNTLTMEAVPVTFFGYYLPALDRGNQIAFFLDGDLLFTFNPASADAIVGTCPSGSNAYCGNPTAPFLGQNTGESYAFFNFRIPGGFDEVRFFESPPVGGYETDNHTIGIFTPGGGGGGTEIPGPAALGLFGLGLLGLAALRRR
jgi:hypothetical protein